MILFIDGVDDRLPIMQSVLCWRTLYCHEAADEQAPCICPMLFTSSRLWTGRHYAGNVSSRTLWNCGWWTSSCKSESHDNAMADRLLGNLACILHTSTSESSPQGLYINGNRWCVAGVWKLGTRGATVLLFSLQGGVFLCVCVCVCVCVCACVRACACVCLFIFIHSKDIHCHVCL